MAKLVLCKGVELEPNYEHTFDFPSATIQGEYFASKKYKEYDTFLQIKDRNTSLFKGIIAKENYDYVKVPDYIDNVRECTYMYWQNDATSKIYYAFITNSYYINEQTSIVEYELDVIQTFLFDYKIECAYIDREHQDRFGSYTTSSAKKKYNILNENLNAGSDYIIKGDDLLCKFYSDTGGVKKPIVWVTIVATETLSAGATTPSQYLTNGNLFVYIIPYVIGKSFTSGSFTALTARNVVGGVTTDYELWSIQGLMGALRNDTMLQNIHQITISGIIPDFNHISIDNSNRIIITNTNLYAPRELTIDGVAHYALMLTSSTSFTEENISNKLGTLSSTFINDTIPLPSSIDSRKTLSPDISRESKLDIYPYKVIQMCHNNNAVDLKIENIKSTNVYGKSNIYGAYSYLIYNENYAETQDAGYRHDNLAYKYGLSSKTINDLPLTTDPYLEYMLTKNAQAITGMAVGTTKGALGAFGGMATFGIGYVNGGISALAGSAMPSIMALGGLAGMVGGMVTAGASVANELARRDDLASTPDALGSLANDGTFSIDSKTLIPVIQYMQIKDEYREQLYQYFRLYGYKANRACYATWSGTTITNDNMNLKSRYYYNYIKCSDINIELGFNRDFHDKLVDIFKKGITFWHYRSDTMSYATFRPFNYTYENIEMSALSS